MQTTLFGPLFLLTYKKMCNICAKGHENISLFTEDKNSLSTILPVPILTHCYVLLLSVCNYNIFSQQSSFDLLVSLSEEANNVFWMHYHCRPLKKTLDIGSDTDVTQSSVEDISRTICDHRSPDQKHFNINHKQLPISKTDTPWGLMIGSHQIFLCDNIFLFWLIRSAKKVGQELHSYISEDPKQCECPSCSRVMWKGSTYWRVEK